MLVSVTWRVPVDQALPLGWSKTSVPLVACDDIAKEFGYVPAKTGTAGESTKCQPPAPVSEKLTDAQIGTSLTGTIWAISRSSTFRTSGDLRPFWIVRGRIVNHYDRDLESATVRLFFYQKGGEKKHEDTIETAVFEVTDIPAGEARGFSRDVQLMIPDDFDFTWTIWSATVRVEK